MLTIYRFIKIDIYFIPAHHIRIASYVRYVILRLRHNFFAMCRLIAITMVAPALESHSNIDTILLLSHCPDGVSRIFEIIIAQRHFTKTFWVLATNL